MIYGQRNHVTRVERNLNKENTKPDYNKVYFGPHWRKMGVQEKSPVHKTLSHPSNQDIFCNPGNQDIFCIDSDTSDGVKSPLLLRKQQKACDVTFNVHLSVTNVHSTDHLNVPVVQEPGVVSAEDDEVSEGPDEGYNSSFGSELPLSTSSPYTSDSEDTTSDSEDISDSDNNEEAGNLLSDSEQSMSSVVSNNTICHVTSQSSLTSLFDRLCTSASSQTSDQSCTASPSSTQTSCQTTQTSCQTTQTAATAHAIAIITRTPSCSTEIQTEGPLSSHCTTQTSLYHTSHCTTQTSLYHTSDTQTSTPSSHTSDTQTAVVKLVSRGCQAEDVVVCELNKKLLQLRDRFNKKLIEEETSRAELGTVQRECTELRMDRFSLLAQADELQKTCVKTMCERDKYRAMVDHKECQLDSLRAKIKMRDEEIQEMRKELKGVSPRQLTDYRELEMLRIDNIRLLHDNRALTSTVDSLNSQLYALRRISKHAEGDELCVLQMNERLAEDNNLLSVNLNTLKREHRNIVQEQEDTLEELRYVRSNYKRTLSERDQFHKELLSVNSGTHSPPTSLLHDNEALVSQNESLKETVSILTEQLSVMREELESVRSCRDIALLDIDSVLEEKQKLQNEMTLLEMSNSELWARLAELRQSCSELSESMEQAKSRHSIVSSENEELRCTNAMLLKSLDELRDELTNVNTTNTDLTTKVSHLNTSLSDASLSMSDLRCTMEFLQVEHECIESEMDKKDSQISLLEKMVQHHKQAKEDLRELCKKKLKEKTKQLNLTRIKLGYALLEIRELNSQGSTASSTSQSSTTSSKSTSSLLSPHNC